MSVSNTLSRQQIHDAVIWACQQEVMAPKPGNVNGFRNGHNMEINDFLKSAQAIAPIMAQPQLTIGERILESVKATRTVVDSNTNLGIILLFAPLVDAVVRCQQFDELRSQLHHSLLNLSVFDAEKTYEAIRLAEAGGLGKSNEQDIFEKPTVTLREAMNLAANRDTIAAEYMSDFAVVWEICYKQLTIALNAGETVEWATALAYLYVLSSVPDTLIARKQSREQAQAVTEQAKLFILKLNKIKSLSSLSDALDAWDQQLKRQAINPGTSADLMAATLLLHRFEHLFSLNSISASRCENSSC